MKQKLAIVLLVVFCFSIFLMVPTKAENELVYVLPIEGTIEKGLSEMLKRAFAEAELEGASLVVLEIDSPGGYVAAAEEIEKLLQQQKMPVVAYVTGGARSAGALIAFSADELIMAPGTTIGAAEPRIGTEKADEKTVSAWSSRMAARASMAAEKNGRDPDRAAELAKGMVDSDIIIPGVVEAGKLLTLTDREARELGLSDGNASSLEELLKMKGFEGASVQKYQISLAEQVARWVTSPTVMPILLTIGIAGLVIEIFTIGFGIPGTLGVMALLLYFGGSILTGLSGWETVLIFFIGLVLLAVEVLVLPGFGIAGIAGIAALVISIVMAAPSKEQAVMSLVLAMGGTILLLILSIKLMPSRKVWRKLVLGAKQEKETGYVAPELNLEKLLNAQGVTKTILRPAGTIEIDGDKIDVVAEGSYIPANTPVKIVKVEGTRVVVREL